MIVATSTGALGSPAQYTLSGASVPGSRHKALKLDWFKASLRKASLQAAGIARFGANLVVSSVTESVDLGFAVLLRFGVF
jgi:hypothetical protein